jgi:hypothetical protein
VNGDGAVNRADVIDTMLGGFASSGEPGYDEARDLDGDGSITARDVIGVRNLTASALPHGASPAAPLAAAVTAIAPAAPDGDSVDAERPNPERPNPGHHRPDRPSPQDLRRLLARVRRHVDATDTSLREFAQEHPRVARVLRAIRNHRDG